MDYTFFNPLTPRQKFLLKIFSPLNKLFAKLKWNIEITGKPANEEMITVEQRINLFHLINEMLVHNIQGDFIELGCHGGKSALQIQRMLENYKSHRQFHVYDAFNLTYETSLKIKFFDNFKKANVTLPVIHEGLFSDTIPGKLPAKLAFIHIDIATGENQVELMDAILHLLEHIYPRMSRNAICLIMDYYDVHKTIGGSDSFPGIKVACDTFFEDKPEKMYVLYGNHFPHGYFRKK